MGARTVEEYIAGLEDWQAEIASDLRLIVREAAPGASEAIKWAQPVYEESGPVCYFKAFKTSVNFGFWRGAQLDDPEGILEGSGEKMRHVKVASRDQIREEVFRDFVRQAVELNRELGNPTLGS